MAGAQIIEMQQELQRLRPELIQTSTETGKLMTRIEYETVEVENGREVVASNEAKANQAATKAQSIKVVCIEI